MLGVVRFGTTKLVQNNDASDELAIFCQAQDREDFEV